MITIREKTVCFTGHRPEKLPEDQSSLSMIKSMLYYQIQQAVEDGYQYFISGLARGIDLWAAEYVLDIKKIFPYIKLIGAKPFEAHNNGFKGEDLWILSNIINHADEIICVSQHYSKNCYRLRNCFMVDNSARLIAVIDNYKSGTGQTINYARKKGLDIKTINVKDFINEKSHQALSYDCFFHSV